MTGVFAPAPPGPAVTPAAPDPGPLESSADRLYARWDPYWSLDAENGYVLKHLAAVLASPREDLDLIIRDSDTYEAWQLIFDPLLCPVWVLPWLAQFVGVTLQASDTIALARARIKAAAGLYRGTQRAIRESVQTTLTGTQTVRIVKTGPWALSVLTRTAETPDAAAAERAARAQKPAGVVMTVAVSDEPFIDEFTRTIDAITATIDSLTLADVT